MTARTWLLMATIKSFHEQPSIAGRVHPTSAECGYRAFDSGGRRFLQLDTYGSDDRAIPGKVSQSLQLDVESARQLTKILEGAFPDL
jgi:hypothetical protein